MAKIITFSLALARLYSSGPRYHWWPPRGLALAELYPWRGDDLRDWYYQMTNNKDDVVVELDGMCNYLPIGDGIVTAGQPSEEHLRRLASGGFEAVVNLGLLDPKYCLPNEAASVAALGMSYHHSGDFSESVGSGL